MTVRKAIRILGLAPLALAVACAGQPAQDKAAKADDPYCLRDTGSRTKPAQDGCRGTGRTVTQEELNRTGARHGTGDALGHVIPLHP